MINQKIIFYYVIFSWIGLWASLGSNPYDFLFIFEKEDSLFSIFVNMNLTQTVNFLRSIFIPLSMVISFMILIKFREKKIDNLILILISIQFLQIISTYLSSYTRISELESSMDHIGRYFWIFSSLSALALYLISRKLGERSGKITFYISIIFLILITFFFSYKIVVDFVILPSEKSVYHLSIFRESAYFLAHEIPRVTGLSRTLLFLYIFALFYKSDFEIYNNFIRYFFLIIFGSLLILFQSKFGVISFILLNIIFFFISKNKLKTIKFIFILLFFQLFLIFTILAFKSLYSKYISNYANINKIEKYTLNEDILERIPEVKEKETIDKFNFNFLRTYPLPTNIIKESKNPLIKSLDGIIFSGRVELWIDTLKFSMERPILGYGSMADRIFLNYHKDGKKKFIEPVSNAYIYALVSGGIPSLFLFLLFWKVLIHRNILFYSKKITLTREHKIGFMLIFFIFLRTLIENSFMLFGIDFIVIIHAISLITKK